MAFDFPASPSEGQIFNAPGGPSYVFNTPVWKAVGQGQIAIISDTPPASPANGALWYESDSGVLYIWYNDGNSSQWVQVGGIMQPPAVEASGTFKISEGTLLVAAPQIDIALPAGYLQLKLHLSEIAASAVASIVGRFSYDNGATYISTAFYPNVIDVLTSASAPGGWVASGTQTGAAFTFFGALSANTFNVAGFGEYTLNRPPNGTYQGIFGTGHHYDGTGYLQTRMVARCVAAGTDKMATHIRVYSGAGNILAGARWQLNGVK